MLARASAHPCLVAHDDLGPLADSSASPAVRLLPAYDQWLLGPGTADPHVVPPARRSLLSRATPPVVHGGVVAGTWRLSGDDVLVTWFGDAGPVPEREVEDEAARLGAVVGRPLTVLTRGG